MTYLVLLYNMWSFLRHLNYYKKIFATIPFFEFISYQKKDPKQFISPCIRMSGKNKIFSDKKISKSNFCKKKKLSKIDDIDVDKIFVSKKESYGTKK